MSTSPSTPTSPSTSTSPEAPATLPPPPPSADELYRAAEAALGNRDAPAADRALAQLVATAPTSPLVGQALLERARIAYERHAYSDARHHLDVLASLPDRSLAEPGHYLTCRIAVESRAPDAASCLVAFRVAYPGSAHDRDVLGTLAQLAYATGGCGGAASYVAELARLHPHSALAAAWQTTCPEAK